MGLREGGTSAVYLVLVIILDFDGGFSKWDIPLHIRANWIKTLIRVDINVSKENYSRRD